jgi:hypothetical protein
MLCGMLLRRRSCRLYLLGKGSHMYWAEPQHDDGEVCVWANDNEVHYAIQPRVHLLDFSSNFQLRVNVPAQELLRLGFDDVLREPRNLFVQQLRRNVLLDIFQIHCESHPRPPLVQVLPQANAQAGPSSAWSSASIVPSYAPRRLFLAPSMCPSRAPITRIQKTRSHLPTIVVLVRSVSRVERPTHRIRSMNRRRAPYGSLSPSVHPHLRG